MGYIVSIIILGYAIIQHIGRKTWVCPDTIFCYEWGIISLFASFHFFDMYETSWKTWVIILIGTIFFVIGVRLGRRFKSKNSSRVNIVHENHLLSKRAFWIISIFLMLMLMKDLITSIVLMGDGYTLGEIRRASYGIIEITGYKFKSGFIIEIIDLLSEVLKIIVVATGIEYFIFNPKENYKMLFIAMILIVIEAFSNGGRFNFAYFAIELFVCFTFYKRYGQSININISKKTKKKVRRLLLLVICLIILLTIIRGTNVNSLISKYYRYLCGNIKFFDLHVEKLDKANFWSYGYASLYGFWNVILPFINKLGFNFPTLYLNTVENVMTTQEFARIGTSMYTNAFITPFYHLYADFRLLGVCLGMLWFGIISGKYFRKAYDSVDGKNITCYLIISQMIFKTLQFYPLVSKSYVLILVIIGVLLCERKIGFKRKEYIRN